jgi:hypothetical protein
MVKDGFIASGRISMWRELSIYRVDDRVEMIAAMSDTSGARSAESRAEARAADAETARADVEHFLDEDDEVRGEEIEATAGISDAGGPSAPTLAEAETQTSKVVGLEAAKHLRSLMRQIEELRLKCYNLARRRSLRSLDERRGEVRPVRGLHR